MCKSKNTTLHVQKETRSQEVLRIYEYKAESLLQCYLILQLDSSNTLVCFTEMHWLINILTYHRIRTQDTAETSKYTTEAAECQKL